VRGDVHGGQPEGHHPQHVALPRGERVRAGLHRRGDQRRVDDPFALGDPADRVGEVVRPGVLADQATHPGTPGGVHGLPVVGVGEDDGAALRAGRGEPFGDAHRRTGQQVDVDHCDVRLDRAGHRYRLVDGPDRGGDVEIVLAGQGGGEGAAQQAHPLDDQHPDRVRASRADDG